MGMTFEQYWLDDPWLYCAYREAEAMRQESQAWDRWSMGAYVYHAIGDLVPVLNPFSKKHKAEKYLEKPFEVSAKESSEKTPEEMEKESHSRTREWMLSFSVSSEEE